MEGQTFPLGGVITWYYRIMRASAGPECATSPSSACGATAHPSFGCSVCPPLGSARSHVSAPGEPWLLPGMGPAPVCAGIMALYFHEVGSTGCAGRRRQTRGMKAPTSHTCGGGIPASPSARHSRAVDGKGPRFPLRGLLQTLLLPGTTHRGVKSPRRRWEPRMDSRC